VLCHDDSAINVAVDITIIIINNKTQISLHRQMLVHEHTDRNTDPSLTGLLSHSGKMLAVSAGIMC